LKARAFSAGTDAGSEGVIGATGIGSSVGVAAITAGGSTGGDVVCSAWSMRGAACSSDEAGADSASGGLVLVLRSSCRSSVFGLAVALGLAAGFGAMAAFAPFASLSGSVAGASRVISATKDPEADGDRGTADVLGTDGSPGSCDGDTDESGGGRGASSATCKSAPSYLRSCHAKPMPGSHEPWPPNARLSRNAWNDSESTSATVSRRP